LRRARLGILAPMKIDKTTKNKTRQAKPQTPGAGGAQTNAAAPKSAATKSHSSTKTRQAASSKTASATPKSFSPTSQNTTRQTTAKSKKAAFLPTVDVTPAIRAGSAADVVATNEEAIGEEVAEGISRADIKEAARILKSSGSKKRERRKAASVMSVAGSSKGGQNRARNLSPEKLKEIATLGGLARQAKARERAEQGLPNTRPRRAPMARSLSGDTR